MKDYWVKIPIAGYIEGSIQADNEKEAIDKAFKINWSIGLYEADGFDADGFDTDGFDIGEIDSYRKIVEGNVLHSPLNEPEAEEE
jgi:hypothetical protein